MVELAGGTAEGAQAAHRRSHLGVGRGEAEFGGVVVHRRAGDRLLHHRSPHAHPLGHVGGDLGAQPVALVADHVVVGALEGVGADFLAADGGQPGGGLAGEDVGHAPDNEAQRQRAHHQGGEERLGDAVKPLNHEGSPGGG